MFSSHPSQPMVNERGLPDTGPRNDCNDVDILVCPCAIQKSDIILSTKNITSGNRQSGYGNLLRPQSCRRLTSSDTRSGRGRLQEALTSDSTARIDSACYRRYSLQKFRWILKAPRRVFFEKLLEQS